VLPYNRTEPVFFERRNDNNRRRIFARVQGFQNRHPMDPRVCIKDDGDHIFEVLVAEVEKILRSPNETDITINARCGIRDGTRRIGICI
jgi:hypothetical protein